ncbi:hypothetical protein ACFORL_08285 [Legionella dresdenensis]|uniref:Ankyrin repeat protein n=1 Tax=Legionella dresdenensis TaxID=450200 RepID=A0ABV8CFH5_9GAMM
MSITLDNIKKFLAERAPLERSEAIPLNHTELVWQITADEYNEELALLKDLVEQTPDIEEFLAQFKQQCQQRAGQIANSHLSFIDYPESPANQLYWNLARSAGLGETLGQLLVLMLPAETKILDVKLAEQDGEDTLDSQEIMLADAVEQGALAEEPELESLHHFIPDGTLLFDARTVAEFNFTQHQLLRPNLAGYGEQLSAKFYCHNEFLEILYGHLQAANRGLELKALLQWFLENAGDLKNFHFYLDDLPEEVREEMFALSEEDESARTFYDALLLLEEGNAEEAQQIMEAVARNPANQEFLCSIPEMVDHEGIRQLYSGIKLSTRGTHDVYNKFDDSRFEKCLAHVVINDVPGLIELLRNAAPSFYETLLKFITIDADDNFFHELINAIGDELPPQHQQCLIDALTLHQEKFPAFEQLILEASEIESAVDPEKEALSEIIDTLICSIEYGKGSRWTSGKGSDKVEKLSSLKNNIAAKETDAIIAELATICQMRRNPLHFWAAPDSAFELELLLTAKGLVRSDNTVTASV